MNVDYDLVVIGNTPEGIHAALKAVALSARVALVEQPFLGRWPAKEHIYGPSFLHFTHSWQQLPEIWPDMPSPTDWSPLQRWARGVDKVWTSSSSSVQLAAQGVDFIRGSGQFEGQSGWEFRTESRILRSRSYLLATGSRLKYPSITGLGEIGCLTPFALGQMSDLASLPPRLLISGSTLIAIQLAQILQRLGKKITLLLDTPSLLPQVDLDLAYLLQAQLEAEGIALFPHSPVSQIKFIEGQKWVLGGNQAFAADELILATAEQGNTEGLNLSAIGVETTPQGLRVKPTLQTTHPRIYACGGVINGYSLANIARYEAEIALKNALFLPVQPASYHGIPSVWLTDPPLATVGINEQEARRFYGQDFAVFKTPFKFNLKAQILGETTGFCKLIVRGKDEILGGQVIGYQAEELIQAIALAIRQKIPLRRLAESSYSLGSLTDIIAATAQQGQLDSSWARKWRTRWLIWQRQRIKD